MNKPAHQCPDCDRSFPSPNALIAHRRWHTRKPPGPIQPAFTLRYCPGCGLDAQACAAALKHRPLIYCPTCGTNLKLVEHALATIDGLSHES